MKKEFAQYTCDLCGYQEQPQDTALPNDWIQITVENKLVEAKKKQIETET